MPGYAETANRNLAGHRALVTGAGGNIGSGIARALAGAGADVVIHYRLSREPAQTLRDELRGAGVDVLSVQADLEDAGAVARLFAAIEDSGPAVDLIVNNAAAQPVQALSDMQADDWREVLSANLDAAFAVIQFAVRRLRDLRKQGAVVNIASIEGSDPAVGHAHYAASKAALLMLTRACALEYGPRGIRVNAVSPGLIDRPGLESDWPDGVARWRAKAPLTRLGTAADVAGAVLFLLGPAASWISGANLVVDGGMSAVSRW